MITHMYTSLLASMGLITSWRRSKKKMISNDRVNDWKRKKSVCQAYDQTDNSTVQLDLHHSLWLFINPNPPCLLTPSPQRISISVLLRLIARGDCCAAALSWGLTLHCSFASVRVMERGYQPPFSSPLQRKRPGKEKERGWREHLVWWSFFLPVLWQNVSLRQRGTLISVRWRLNKRLLYSDPSYLFSMA